MATRSVVTFLFTDIEDSTRMWEGHPDAMEVALARHDARLRRARSRLSTDSLLAATRRD
jgi:class 3 adenylate cyclase